MTLSQVPVPSPVPVCMPTYTLTGTLDNNYETISGFEFKCCPDSAVEKYADGNNSIIQAPVPSNEKCSSYPQDKTWTNRAKPGLV